VDEAIRVAPAVEEMLKQRKGERATLPESFDALRGALS
jgi:flagellum-specific ATP synthase